jgi:glycerol-3-phosphate O-acyltransferase/dihydroxyacetone phosphate acyltransferase
MAVSERIAPVAYRLAHWIFDGATRVYFRRIDVGHRERVPRRGALLVVSNHPATFTDVIVLATAIPRQLHFLAMAPIFKPWIRGFGLRMCGTLPVYRRQDDQSQMGRNDETFRACHEILDQGGAVLIFPEGTSLTDRSVVPIKTGAARIALGQEGRPGQEGRLTLLPVGLHFVERTKFRSDVTVSVGPPLDLAPHRAAALADPQGAVRALTAEIQSALERLIVNVPDTTHTTLVDAVDRVYRGAEGGTDGAGLQFTQTVAEAVDYFAREDPERVAEARTRLRRYERRLTRLEVSDRAVRDMLPPPGRVLERSRLLMLGLAGLGPALAGYALHALPYHLCGFVGSKVAAPTLLAAVRISTGVVAYPLTYLAIGYGLYNGLGWSPRAIVIALAGAAILGVFSMVYMGWLAHQRDRLRLVWHRFRRPRRIARLRYERAELIRLFDQARLEFTEARRGPASGSFDE